MGRRTLFGPNSVQRRQVTIAMAPPYQNRNKDADEHQQNEENAHEGVRFNESDEVRQAVYAVDQVEEID
jgi:hypothetical protein